MCNLIVSTVPADALAPLGARASADTMMVKISSHMCKGPATEIWIMFCLDNI